MATELSDHAIYMSPASADLCFDLSSDQHPTVVAAWNASILRLDDRGSHYGFVQSGQATLVTKWGAFYLSEEMYFCVPGKAEILGSGAGFVVSRIGYYGFFQVGGPSENAGRLQYIDGCTDSLLVSPIINGDPCLNLLHIPPGTQQTAHTHPSLRAGIIASGEGLCQTPRTAIPLAPGTVFIIPAGKLHSFHTQTLALRVIAWHPDSDFGPTHEVHPMVNRTIIDGLPATSRG